MDGDKFSLINSALNESKIKRDKKQKEDELRKEKEKNRLEDLMVIENEFAPMKQKFFDEIIQWKNEFIKTDEFKEIYQVISQDFFHLQIFGAGWGHEIPYKNDHGCWSQLHLEKEGKLTYLSGYKWMGLRIKLNLEKDIEKFSSVYIQELHEYIKSGKVYEFIADKIKNLYSLFIH